MKICDKCGTTKRNEVGYNGKRLLKVNIRKIMLPYSKPNVYTYERFELCVKCWVKYEKYLKRFFKKEKLYKPPISKLMMATLLPLLFQKIEK